MNTLYRICFALFLLGANIIQGAETDYDDLVKAFLRNNFADQNFGMVIGIVDERGSKVFSAGKCDNESNQEINGDTIFEIGSITKTFTTLLLEEMVDRGDMKLDDPVAKYLPKSVKVPSHNGKEITLRDLATQSSGLPFNPTNLSSGANLFADYSAEKLYAFLSHFTLTRDPGTDFQYSNVGMGLLGHAITLKAGADFDSLIVNRIARPLQMDGTGASLTPEMKNRLAVGHNAAARPVPNWEFQSLAGCGALHSTANDLLKYVAANLGLVQSPLTPLMEKTHVFSHHDSHGFGNTPGFFGRTAMPWVDEGEGEQTGLDIRLHAGGTAGYSAFIGFEKSQRRGVVVLLNQQGELHSESIGKLLLERVALTPKIASTLTIGKEVVGIGAKLDFDSQNHLLQITKIIPNSPAEEMGLTAGLLVDEIDGISTTHKSVLECSALIRGDAGTSVRLEVFDPTKKESRTIELIRRKVNI
ncbi:MAG TPA: serine hydrolase [Pirellulales bacterium]|nr:serine hydrolase [Pirellulales bacterium]